MPGRSLNPNSYRYSINGQEKTPEIGPNTTTAEFWQYDARIGRRWNIDPVFKEYESPYAAFANNPIWFKDADGADTVKYLSNSQLLDAVKMARSQAQKAAIKNVETEDYYNDAVKQELNNSISAYAKQGGLNTGESIEFSETVHEYYTMYFNIFTTKHSVLAADDASLSNPNTTDAEKVGIQVYTISLYEKWRRNIMGTTATFTGIMAGYVGIKATSNANTIGTGPRKNVTLPKVIVSGKRSYYRGGNDFTFKANEIRLDANGMVKPTHGVSLFSSQQKIPTKFDVYKITDMPKELKIIQRGNDPKHFEIVPKTPMSKEDFQKYLDQIKTQKVTGG